MFDRLEVEICLPICIELLKKKDLLIKFGILNPQKILNCNIIVLTQNTNLEISLVIHCIALT